MKNIRDIRNKTISFAVTQDLYDLIKQKADQVDATPSTFSYKVFLDWFKDELEERRNNG